MTIADLLKPPPLDVTHAHSKAVIILCCYGIPFQRTGLQTKQGSHPGNSSHTPISRDLD